jgi:hypothetical protein
VFRKEKTQKKQWYESDRFTGRPGGAWMTRRDQWVTKKK